MRGVVTVLACLLALTACGGGDDGGSAPPPAPPPAAPPPPPVIGNSGGTISESTGAQVIFPAGAVTTDTTFRIAVDSTNAPVRPADLGATGSVYAITPHGGNFAAPVEVRIPAPAVALTPNQVMKLAKADPNGEWVIYDDTELVDGTLRLSVNSFSFFMPVVINYLRPIVETPPLSFSNPTLTCQGNPSCQDHVNTTLTFTYSVVGNNGAIPANCANFQAYIGFGEGAGTRAIERSPYGAPIPPTGGATTQNVSRGPGRLYSAGVFYRCGNGIRTVLSHELVLQASWRQRPQYPAVTLISAPSQVDVVEGTTAILEVLAEGGAITWDFAGSVATQPSVTDRAIIDWEYSGDNGASWRAIARSFQNEANRNPVLGARDWEYWAARHGIVVTASDQGALIRARACYAPPAPTEALPCHTGPTTRINVLQQSALPGFSDQPRSVLIRTGETANFSANATGNPAPTLQWQRRAANSTGAWSNVTAGTGATTANYTTPGRSISDNGEQYRLLATNAVGSTSSVVVTLSVSDLDVAPTITSQPTEITVTQGNDALFAVAARGTEALSYQWRFNGTNMPGANGSVLRLTGVTMADEGDYSVIVSNSAGSVTSNAAPLYVTEGTPAAVAPTINTQPRGMNANVGNTATFAVGADGTGPLSYQWRRNGVNMPGATSPVLTFSNVQLPNEGEYSVVVMNSAGAIVSGNAYLSVLPTPVVTAPSITAEPAIAIVPIGGSATLAVGATGTGPLAYQWSHDGTPIPGATLPVLNFNPVTAANAGLYTVQVSNSVGSVTSQAGQLIMLSEPEIIQQPANTTALEGQTATFNVEAASQFMAYQWLRNGVPISGARQANYTTQPLALSDSGAVYSVLVFNGSGVAFSQNAVLTVVAMAAPQVTQHPVGAMIDAGESTPLCAAFAGTVPMELRLQRWDGEFWVPTLTTTLTSNAQNCIDSPPIAQEDNVVYYRFVAVNAAGQAITDTAEVRVATPFTPVSQTVLVSEALSGTAPDYASGKPSISRNGRYVAFLSGGTSMVNGVENPSALNHAYRRDLRTGVLTLINRAQNGGVSALGVVDLEISADGRYVVFTSFARDLVADDTNDALDVFLRDMQSGTTQRLSVSNNGNEIAGATSNYDARLGISADGRWVTFLAAHDMEGDARANTDYFLYLRDVQTRVTRRLIGAPGEPAIGYGALSANGEYYAYAPNIIAPNDQIIELYDLEANSRAEVFRFAQSPSPAGLRQGLSISSDGRYIAFSLSSAALTGNSQSQIMRIDTQNPGMAALVSTSDDGVGDGPSIWPRLSDDGRYVVFASTAPNLTAGLATPSQPYLVRRDMVAGATTIASRNVALYPVYVVADGPHTHALSGDGLTLTYSADHAVVVSGGAPGTQVFAQPRP